MIGDRLRVWDGAMTEEVSLLPGGFGLGKLPARLRPGRTAAMVCGYCSTGCSLNVHVKDGGAVNRTPDVDYPVNRGMACPKGWEALAPLAADDRITRPLLHGEPVDWHVALETFCSRFKGIQQRHGAGSIAFLSTGQICSEEMALLGSLAKFGMGMVHGDLARVRSRHSHGPSVAGGVSRSGGRGVSTRGTRQCALRRRLSI